MTTTALMII